MSESGLLAAAAVVFALVTGANDGATLVAINLPNPAIRPTTAIVILAVAVVVIPLIAGARVAETLAHGLVSFEGAGGEGRFLGAVAAALAVVFLLAPRAADEPHARAPGGDRRHGARPWAPRVVANRARRRPDGLGRAGGELDRRPARRAGLRPPPGAWPRLDAVCGRWA